MPFPSNGIVDGEKDAIFSIYLQKVTFVKKTVMEGTQTRTIAASLFAVLAASLNEGLALLVWCSTELWRRVTGLRTFVAKVSL